MKANNRRVRPRICAAEGCDRVHDYTSRLCPAHYGRAKLGQDMLRPIERRRPATERDEDGHKFCGGCDTWKAEDEFYACGTHTSDGLMSRCKSCHKAAVAARKARKRGAA